ncbi:MAG TPA: hypothetical protein VE111_00125, partial [Bradyrhizobium sp.]|nr:hypothetical protein [Bradyrhizobium sp.]
ACRLATPHQGTPNTGPENYIQFYRAASTTTGQNKKTRYIKVFQQTARTRRRRRFAALVRANQPAFREPRCSGGNGFLQGLARWPDRSP